MEINCKKAIKFNNEFLPTNHDSRRSKIRAIRTIDNKHFSLAAESAHTRAWPDEDAKWKIQKYRKSRRSTSHHGSSDMQIEEDWPSLLVWALKSLACDALQRGRLFPEKNINRKNLSFHPLEFGQIRPESAQQSDKQSWKRSSPGNDPGRRNSKKRKNWSSFAEARCTSPEQEARGIRQEWTRKNVEVSETIERIERELEAHEKPAREARLEKLRPRARSQDIKI